MIQGGNSPPSEKWRKVPRTTASVSESEKKQLRNTLRQFAPTLDSEADNVLAVQVSESIVHYGSHVLNCRAHTVFLQTGNLVS